ncbi:MAG: hypothetical protein GAK43_01004 [Stenotrophomonas maltophilia]|nr:MAG: hypothetical protein GAK43_01004 [Stenotrophomonas maltophilia]
MTTWKWWVVPLFASLLGCSGGHEGERAAAGAAAFQGEQAKAGSALAYEHQVGIRLPVERIDPQLSAAREACSSERFGPCDLLGIRQEGDERHRSAQLVVRIAPDAVEKMVALAASGGELQRRETRAEDLAQAVADTQRTRERLERQYQTLQSYQNRKDLSVADLLALAKELASVEEQLQVSSQTAAQQQRRITSNLLTLDFSSEYQRDGRWQRIAEAFGNSLDNLTEGTVNAVEVSATGLPLLIVLVIAALIVRALWRRVGRKRQARGEKS